MELPAGECGRDVEVSEQVKHGGVLGEEED